MNRIRIDEDIKPMSEFRSGISTFVKQVHKTKRPMVITQHGKGVAVLVDAAEFEAMQQRIELFDDVQVSSAQLEAGKAIEHESVQKRIMERLQG